jgi:Histidine kinase-, DNA gyrase B-, and HSP90-like ATPase
LAQSLHGEADAYEQEGTMKHLNQAPAQALLEDSSASEEQARRPERRLQGRVLVIARVLWLLIVLFEIGILLVNLPVLIALVHTACRAPTGVVCNYLQLHPSQLPALSHYGFELSGYALYALTCDLVVTLLFLSMGILIFWHKSTEFMALFVSLLLITFGCFGISEVHLIVPLPSIANLIPGLLVVLQWPALGILFYTFPDGRFVPRWAWMLASLFVIQFCFYLSRRESAPSGYPSLSLSRFLINRTLVYALLTASTLGSYVLVVFGASAVLRSQNDLFLSLLATALIAVLFQPLRQFYALRPPALDDLGLLAALQEQMTQYHASGIVLTLDAPEALPPLPAATEIACYRIVQEALTNVVRHAHATSATVQLRVQENLEVEVRDDGLGLPPGVRSGVGLSSMRERAEELGGTCLVETMATAGTCVCARLPLLVGQHDANETSQHEEATR